MLNSFLEVVSGDTLAFRVILRDGLSPIDGTRITFSGGVRRSGTNTNIADFNFHVDPDSPDIVRVTLTPDQTKRLPTTEQMYEWYVRAQDGDYAKTLGLGALRVTRL